jgi:hypothetical protein
VEAAPAGLDRPSGDHFLFCPWVAASFLRLARNPRIFVQPSTADDAGAFVDTLESRAHPVRTEIDPMTRGIFKHVCLVSEAAGNDIPDALFASIAIRHDVEFLTTDRGLGRFEGLNCRYIGA